MRKLTAKQQKFIDGVVSGMTQADAYRAAYDCKRYSVESLATQASKLANAPHIRPIIAERKKEMENAALWTRIEALEKLRGIIDAAVRYMVDQGKYSAAAAQAATRAIEQANKMCGYNEPEKVQVSGSFGVEVSDLDELLRLAGYKKA